jgi:pullulanase/glycogen debranching enzyme
MKMLSNQDTMTHSGDRGFKAASLYFTENLHRLFSTLYPGSETATGIYEGCESVDDKRKNEMISEYTNKLYIMQHQLNVTSFHNQYLFEKKEAQWYCNAVMYELYVDLFATNFELLITRLDYLQDLGVSLLHLLPIMSSPMRGKRLCHC